MKSSKPPSLFHTHEAILIWYVRMSRAALRNGKALLRESYFENLEEGVQEKLEAEAAQFLGRHFLTCGLNQLMM